jgi:ABC-type nitrate/sulfonate/bicarbonate transport system permease component
MKRSTWIAGMIVLVFLLLWQGMVWSFKLPPYLLPAPSLVVLTLVTNASMYAAASLVTLGEALAGLLLGLLASVLIASLLSLRPALEEGVMTLAILVKSTPLVAIAPLLTLWFGFGILPKILITSLVTFFPLLVNLLTGLQRVDRALIDLFKSWNASRWDIFSNLRLPSSLPFLFAGLKISAPLALIGAVVGEWTGASNGLGRTMWLAYSNLNLPYLFAPILILALAGMLAYRFLVWIEKKCVFWQAISMDE